MCVGRTIFMVILASFFLLMYFCKREIYGSLFLCFTLSAAALAFFAEPIYDLFNYYYGTLEPMSHMSVSAFWAVNQEADEFLSQVYFFLISKLPFKGFLPLITTLIVYGILLSMLWRWSRSCWRKSINGSAGSAILGRR